VKKKEILQKRRKIAASLPGPEEVLRGSLLERTIFHRKGCSRCEAGQGHMVLVLTVTYPGGRNRQFSIRPEQRKMVQRWLDNYRDWKRKMEEICELNHALLRAED
jgi:hypothetical protein